MGSRRKQKSGSGLGASLLSALLGGGLFLLFMGIFQVGLPFSLVAAVAGYGAGMLLFSPRKKDDGITMQLSGLSQESIERTIREGEDKLCQIQALKSQVRKPMIKNKVKEICTLIEKILEDFEKDPKDIKIARQFMNYYLDATIKILTRYVDISAQPVLSDKMQETVEKAERLIESIRKAFEIQLVKLLQDDVLDLDVEMSVLENTLKMEGMEDMN